MARKRIEPEGAEDCLKTLGVKTWAEALVLLAYGDVYDLPVRSLDFRTEDMKPDRVVPAIRLVPGYNNFVGKDVAEAVQSLHNSGILMSASFGREGSPVLYLKAPYWTHQRSNESGFSQGEQIPTELRESYLTWIEEAMRELKADEINRLESPAGVNSPGIRAWWD